MIEEQTTYTTERPFKPNLYVGKIYEITNQISSRTHKNCSALKSETYWTGEYVQVAHLDSSGRIIRMRQLAVSNLEDELSAFDYKAMPVSPGFMVEMSDKLQLKRSLQNELHDVFPSAAEFDRQGAVWKALVFVPDGSYTLTFRPGKERGTESQLHLQTRAYKQESKETFFDDSYRDEEPVVHIRLSEANLREELEDLKSNIPDEVP